MLCIHAKSAQESGVLVQEFLNNPDGSTWDPHRGLALSGPLRGASIQKIPFQSSFDWAWNDFFPGAGLWGERKR